MGWGGVGWGGVVPLQSMVCLLLPCHLLVPLLPACSACVDGPPACLSQDPACMSYSQALLHFKGFHAIQVGGCRHSGALAAVLREGLSPLGKASL